MQNMKTASNETQSTTGRATLLMSSMPFAVAALVLVPAGEARQSGQQPGEASPPSEPGAIWQAPTDIKTRDLFYGPGGKDRQPQGKLTFVEEDLGATNPKFTVVDER